MKRYILDELQKWKISKRRKPLILKGARQVGKTWALTEFGKSFPDGYAYFNFDKEDEYKQFFETTKDVNRIMRNLSMASGQRITKETLIIFDEIQECPEALNALKYFYEDEPEYYVVSAGSLLGLQLSKGFPVGKVEFIEMGPMNFSEFLLASGEEKYVEYLNQIDCIDSIPEAFFNPLVELLKMYYITGGMPEAVLVWTEDGDVKAVDKVLSDILDAYERDFGKHTEKAVAHKVKLIWDSVPSQLSKENKKFLYSVVKEGARAREYEDALNWLYDANLIEKIYRSTKPGLPISAYDDLGAFKIYLGDVGLLRRHAKLATSAFAEQNRLFVEFKGALTENFILQSLRGKFEVVPRYWTMAPYEVDFLLQYENDIFPIEVKAGESVKGSSLKQYQKKYDAETKLAVRFSLKNLSFDGKVLNVPLFMVNQLEKLIEIALSETE